MSNYRALPAPHGHVCVTASEYEWGAVVQYLGEPDAIIAAGAAPSVILSTQRRKRDENGDSILIVKKPLKSAPRRVLVTRIVKKGDARALPGVRECLERAQRQPRNASSRSDWLTSILCDAAGVFGNVPVRPRHAIVGRFQRPVDYVAVGDHLLIPDWSYIQASVTVNRGRS